MYYLVYGILLLASTCQCKGQDVVLTATSDCYNVNDNMTLEAEYKGSTNISGVTWTVSGVSFRMIITVPECSPFATPSGFPDDRMSHDCSFAPKYRLTIQKLDSADFNKTWGVDFSLLTGSTASGRQQQTVTQCEPIDERNTGFPWWTIGLIPLAVCVMAIIYLKDMWDEGMPFTNEANKDIGQEIGSNQLDEGRKSFTNEANKDIEQEIRTNLLNEERRPLTNEANEDIQQRNEIKPVDQSLSFPSIKDTIRYQEERCNIYFSDPTDEPTDEPNTRLTSLGTHVEIGDIKVTTTLQMNLRMNQISV